MQFLYNVHGTTRCKLHYLGSQDGMLVCYQLSPSPAVKLQTQCVVASWLVHSTPVERVQTEVQFVPWQLRDIVLSSLAKHFTLTVPLSTQCTNWYQQIFNTRGNPIQELVEILLVTSCHRKWDLSSCLMSPVPLACVQTKIPIY